jgi:hypothetical protein
MFKHYIINSFIHDKMRTKYRSPAARPQGTSGIRFASYISRGFAHTLPRQERGVLDLLYLLRSERKTSYFSFIRLSSVIKAIDFISGHEEWTLNEN